MSDLAEWANAIASGVLAAAAIIQLPLVAKQVKALAQELKQARDAEAKSAQRAKEQLTLEACQRYDFDPVIEAASARIWAASGGGQDYNKADTRDMIVILNYLDGLAIGIAQKLYLENIVKDHIYTIIDKHVRDFIESGIIKPRGYETLLELQKNWAMNKSYSSETS